MIEHSHLGTIQTLSSGAYRARLQGVFLVGDFPTHASASRNREST